MRSYNSGGLYNRNVCLLLRDVYPESYDVSAKMKSKLFQSIAPMLQLARQEQYIAAAELMTLFTRSVFNSQSWIHTALSLYICYLSQDNKNNNIKQTMNEVLPYVLCLK